jgi:thiol-disulfide isomerase/thioredoxin
MIRIRQLLITAAALCATVLPVGVTPADGKNEVRRMSSTATHLPIEGTLPALAGAIEWINTPPLTMSELRGKVVLVEFWTYTCINWRRTLPYVRAWADKYKDQGLVVIGVHTPEFAFEKDLGNVRHEVKEIGITFPVAVDSDYRIWSAFNNQYWPAMYFVDAHGRIRHHQFGEGDYEQSELAIQRLLAEAGGHNEISHELAAVAPSGVELAADWANLKSPETYTGYERSETFASPGGAELNKRQAYEAPSNLQLNEWALGGDWTVTRDAAIANAANARVVYVFHARDVNLILSPPTGGKSVRFRILLDGKTPGVAHGLDVDDQGNGTLSEPRTYQLIRVPGPISDRRFEIQFLDPGAAVFDFTFG